MFSGGLPLDFGYAASDLLWAVGSGFENTLWFDLESVADILGNFGGSGSSKADHTLCLDLVDETGHFMSRWSVWELWIKP